MDDKQFIDEIQDSNEIQEPVQKPSEPSIDTNTNTNEPSLDNKFAVADTNSDQQLTEEEAKALPEVDTPQEFRLADENNDKLISFDEYKKALPEEERNKIDKSPNKNDRYNAFNDTLDKYYNEYVSTLDPNDPNYDDEVNLAKDDVEDQQRKAGYRDYNSETGKDYIVSPDYDSEKNIANDAHVKSGIKETLDNAINNHNVDEMAELLNDVMPNLPKSTDKEKTENGKKVENSDKISQEGISDEIYERLSSWSFDELYELSQKVPDIKWKKLANVVAKGEVSDKEGQEKRSKEWLQQWENYVSKVDLAADQLNKLSDNHIEKDEVEQILYRDYVQENKGKNTDTTNALVPTSATSTDDDKKPIQITEKTDVREKTTNREKIIRRAAGHIMRHGKSLSKELKKSIQEMPSKFQPFKFEHKKSKKDNSTTTGNGEPLIYNDDDKIDMGRGPASGGESISNGSVMQSSFGNSDGGSSGESVSKGRGINENKNISQKAGGMPLLDLPEAKFSFSGGPSFEGIGDFSKKSRPINIKMPKGTKAKKTEFPDLSPSVEQHNETEKIPHISKNNKPIMKRGLYQAKDDKFDNSLYSNIIKNIITDYKNWKSADDIYIKSIPQLNIMLYYDGVSQPKIRIKDMYNKENISTLLRREGGREVLENLYSYLEEEK